MTDQCPTCGCPTECAEGAYGRLREVADDLADALRFHEERRINPTSRGGPALARYVSLVDGTEAP